MDEASDIIALVDGEGNELLYEIIDVVEHEGSTYAVLLPSDEDAQCDEVTILRVLPGETEDEEIFEGIDDPELLEKVFELFKKDMDAPE